MSKLTEFEMLCVLTPLPVRSSTIGVPNCKKLICEVVKAPTWVEVSDSTCRVVKAATKLGFADTDDAISLVKRADIESEQDEDDPSDVEVDTPSVKAALEALLKKKPHLKASKKDEDEEDEDEEEKPATKRTGSRVGAREKRGKGKNSDEHLRELYPFLRQ